MILYPVYTALTERVGSRSRSLCAVQTVWDREQVEIYMCTNANDADAQDMVNIGFYIEFSQIKKCNNVFLFF